MVTTHRPVEHLEQQLAAASLGLRRHFDVIGATLERVAAIASNHDLLVLGHLHDHPASRPHELMAVTGLSRPNVAAVVARLERLGLVERAFGEHDRRTTLASLTPRGGRQMTSLECALEQHLAESAPLVKEIIDLLGCEQEGLPARGPDDTAVALITRLAEAGAAYEAQIDRTCQRLGLRQRAAISTLMAHGPARPKQLAEALELSSGGLTYVIDELELEGMITRSYGVAVDRRAVVVELTSNGMAYGRLMCSALAATAPQICAILAMSLSSGGGPRSTPSNKRAARAR